MEEEKKKKKQEEDEDGEVKMMTHRETVIQVLFVCLIVLYSFVIVSCFLVSLLSHLVARRKKIYVYSLI